MEQVDINQLKPNPKNPRRISKHDYEKLVQSIKKFGNLSDIVFNITTQQLVGGHQRIEAFKQLGGQPVITERYETPNSVGTTAIGYVMLGDEKFGYRQVQWEAAFETAANIAANRIQGDFDLDLLAELNYELSQLENGADLLALSGQTDEEISKLLDSVSGDENPAEDEAPEVDEVNPPVSKLGEIYQLGGHRLMCGSATDFGQVSDLINGAKIDLVHTDPPYGVAVVKGGMVGADFGVAQKGSYADVIGDDTTETAEQAWQIIEQLDIKKSIIWGGNYFTEFLPPTGSWIVWDKRGDSGIKNTFADCELAWSNDGSPARVYTQLWNGMIREGEHGARVHPTQKPIRTLSEITKDFSERGQNILDLFGGSGSILIACQDLGRTCYMMELSPAYVDVIRKRYAKHIGQEEQWQTATPVIQTAEAETEPATS